MAGPAAPEHLLLDVDPARAWLARGIRATCRRPRRVRGSAAAAVSTPRGVDVSPRGRLAGHSVAVRRRDRVTPASNASRSRPSRGPFSTTRRWPGSRRTPQRFPKVCVRGRTSAAPGRPPTIAASAAGQPRRPRPPTPSARWSATRTVPSSSLRQTCCVFRRRPRTSRRCRHARAAGSFTRCSSSSSWRGMPSTRHHHPRARGCGARAVRPGRGAAARPVA